MNYINLHFEEHNGIQQNRNTLTFYEMQNIKDKNKSYQRNKRLLTSKCQLD